MYLFIATVITVIAIVIITVVVLVIVVDIVIEIVIVSVLVASANDFAIVRFRGLNDFQTKRTHAFLFDTGVRSVVCVMHFSLVCVRV